MSDSTADETRKAVIKAIHRSDGYRGHGHRCSAQCLAADETTQYEADAAVAALAAQQWLIDLVRLAAITIDEEGDGLPQRVLSAVPEPFRSAAGIGDDPR